MFCTCTMFLLELHLLSCAMPYLELERLMVLTLDTFSTYVFKLLVYVDFSQIFMIDVSEMLMRLALLRLQNVQMSSLSSALYSINFYWIPVKEFVLRQSCVS